MQEPSTTRRHFQIKISFQTNNWQQWTNLLTQWTFLQLKSKFLNHRWESDSGIKNNGLEILIRKVHLLLPIGSVDLSTAQE